jgi:hypothetical protein
LSQKSVIGAVDAVEGANMAKLQSFPRFAGVKATPAKVRQSRPGHSAPSPAILAGIREIEREGRGKTSRA